VRLRSARSQVRFLPGASIEGLGTVRAGVHTGECEIAARKVVGVAVVVGARVAALAGPGEVLATSTVKDLVAGSDLAFQPRGARELKGLGEWLLYAVVDSDEAARAYLIAPSRSSL
jgi:class 3 adenylate cyclase